MLQKLCDTILVNHISLICWLYPLTKRLVNNLNLDTGVKYFVSGLIVAKVFLLISLGEVLPKIYDSKELNKILHRFIKTKHFIHWIINSSYFNLCYICTKASTLVNLFKHKKQQIYFTFCLRWKHLAFLTCKKSQLWLLNFCNYTICVVSCILGRDEIKTIMFSRSIFSKFLLAYIFHKVI